jgi:hypothetical protein
LDLLLMVATEPEALRDTVSLGSGVPLRQELSTRYIRKEKVFVFCVTASLG